MGLSDGSLFMKYTYIWLYLNGFALGGRREDRYDTVRWHQVTRFPAMRQTLDDGGTVDFGLLRVEAGGLRRPGLFGGSGKHLPWDQLAKLDVASGSVTIYLRDRRRPWTWVAVADLPNFGSFLALVRPRAAVAEPAG
jgi:hypothetical protein